MSRIKIETVTPVHIGSGNLLQNNSDFVVEIDGDDKYIHIVDDRKVLDLIGHEHIDDWVISIENNNKKLGKHKVESTPSLIKRLAPSSTYSDYSKQRITSFVSNIKPTDTLKEVIHNGLGLPYIPGSSLKGSIRTSILASLVGNVTQKENKIFKRNGRDLSADRIEKELFGSDPNSDIFRFIRVGDAYFENDCLIATKMINLNVRNSSDSLWDESKPQIIEAIGAQEEAFLDINIASDYYDKIKARFRELGTLPREIRTISDLFMLLNEHTRKLVRTEIEYWKDISTEKSDGEDYLDVMNEILEEIEGCKNGKSCVIRVGHGSGWRFITGAWAENLDNFEDKVVSAARPNNYRYEDYDFPKSRRIDDYSDVLGFVKLTVQ